MAPASMLATDYDHDASVVARRANQWNCPSERLPGWPSSMCPLHELLDRDLVDEIRLMTFR